MFATMVDGGASGGGIGAGGADRERKLSSSIAGSKKSKWLKAFKFIELLNSWMETRKDLTL